MVNLQTFKIVPSFFCWSKLLHCKELLTGRCGYVSGSVCHQPDARRQNAALPNFSERQRTMSHPEGRIGDGCCGAWEGLDGKGVQRNLVRLSTSRSQDYANRSGVARGETSHSRPAAGSAPGPPSWPHTRPLCPRSCLRLRVLPLCTLFIKV